MLPTLFRNPFVLLRTGLLLALFWLAFAGLEGWGFALGAVLLGAFLGARLQGSGPRWRWQYLPGVVVYFLRAMVYGAWDVAWRALHPRCPVDPGWTTYQLSEQAADVQVLLSALIGLLPGTLAACIEEGQMRVHVLDRGQDWQPVVAGLEWRLQRLLKGGC